MVCNEVYVKRALGAVDRDLEWGPRKSFDRMLPVQKGGGGQES